MIDEQGIFHNGDLLGTVVADFLKADFAATPISSNDAVDTYLRSRSIESVHTKIGSPYVIAAMQEAEKGEGKTLVGWEVNGGFLVGSDVHLGEGLLKTLPTRDAVLPILVALQSAIDKDCSMSELFQSLPPRYTSAGLLNDFPVEQSLMLKELRDTPDTRERLARVFNEQDGFDQLLTIDTLDGIRMTFGNKDIAHIRPSGNAPQLRIYSVANSQERADAIVARSISEPDGLLRKLSSLVTSK